MNGVHDLGGMHGFGPVELESNEPAFHARWEAVMLTIQRTLTDRTFSIDEFRHAIERMEPARYLAATYYERWLDGICRLLVEKHVIDATALDRLTDSLATGADVLRSQGRQATAPSGSTPPPEASYRRTPEQRPRFAPGDHVITRNHNPPGHTRLPRYARGKRGVVVAHYGTQVFPDTNAHGLGEHAQPLYSVRFEARDLWGDGAEAREAMHLDLWEQYLLPGEAGR